MQIETGVADPATMRGSLNPRPTAAAGRLPVPHVMPLPAGTAAVPYDALKRVLDIVGSFTLIVVTFPILALAAVLVKLTDGGPMLFIQNRVGRGGQVFRCYKLRSMVVDAERVKKELLAANQHADARTFKIVNDPRITWIGKIARKYSIDELPQLFNVLKGDMSLVGPRPPVPSEVALYNSYDFRRLEVKPGLTCLWQISGRSNLAFPEQVKLDVDYIQRRSLAFDLKILLMTIPAVLTAKGAY